MTGPSVQETLDNAVRAYAAEAHPGQVVTGWITVGVTLNADDAHTYFVAAAPTQAEHSSIGLLHAGMDLYELRGNDD